MKRVIIAALISTLAGCVSPQQVSKPVEKKVDFSKYSDLQMCKVKKHFENDELNVNPASHPEYNTNLEHYKLVVEEIKKRNKNHVVAFCDKVISADLEANLTPKQKKAYELSPRQKALREYYICKAIGVYCPHP